jgi:excisionase family DNA binding protein
MLLDQFLSPPRLLEVAHVAHRLSASQEFVRRLIREGKLRAIRIGRRWRVDPADLEAFIDQQRTAGEPRRAARPPDPYLALTR